MDYSCDECYRMRQPSTSICPECGKNTCVSQVIGMTCHVKCSNCDHEVYGFSFFPACVNETLYSIRIDKPDDSRKMVKLARVFAVRPLELQQRFADNDGTLEFKVKTRNYTDVCKQISELGIAFELDQDLLRDYSRIFDCPYVKG